MNDKIRKQIKYIICKPGGNDTALVYGLDYTQEQKRQINNEIMKRHANVEQVGFIDLNKSPELQMAGGEFCGNATRSAANCYLNGKEGNVQIIVNSEDVINAGVYENGKSWCEIPLHYGKDAITKKEQDIYIVKMKGMTTVVIKPNSAKKYLDDRGTLKQYGMELINKYNLENNEAVGVMFCEYQNSKLKINPVVWVKAIDTLFYETACGSGTTATCMVDAFENKESQKIDVLQPSGHVITAEIKFDNNKVTKATIYGNVIFEPNTYRITLEN